MSKSGGAAPECMMDDSVLVPHEVWKIEGFYTNLCIPGYQEWSQSCKRARALGWDIPLYSGIVNIRIFNRLQTLGISLQNMPTGESPQIEATSGSTSGLKIARKLLSQQTISVLFLRYLGRVPELLSNESAVRVAPRSGVRPRSPATW